MRSERPTISSDQAIGLDPSAPDSPSQLGSEVGDLVRRLVCLFGASSPTEPHRLLKADEVADLLNTNKQVVYRLAREKELPAVNLGERMLRFTEGSISEFIRRGGVGADGLRR